MLEPYSYPNDPTMTQLAAVIVAFICGYYVIRTLWKYPNRNIVYGYPLIGSAFTEITRFTMFSTILKYAQQYGPIYDIFVLFRRITVLSDSEDVKEVLSKRPKVFRRIKLSFPHILASSDSILGVEGVDWSKHRRMISPPFSKKNISYFLDEIWHRSKDAAENLLCSQASREIDTIAFITSFTTEIIGLVAFGISKETYSSYFFRDEFKKDLKAMMHYISRRVFFGLPSFLWKISPYYKYEVASHEALERLGKLCLELVELEKNKHDTDNRMNKNKQDSDTTDINQSFIQAIVRAQGDNKFTDKEVIADICTIFIAGTDTTAIGLIWSLYFLTQSPKALQEVRKEIDDVMELERKGTLSKDDLLDKLRLTSACFKEAMRLEGPISHIGAQMMESANLSNYTLKSGRVVYSTDRLLCSIDALKYDECTYEQATEFIPSRWLTTDTKKLAEMEGNLLTFGYGPNICPGMYLSMAEAPIFLCHILYRYDITLACAPSEIYRIANLTISPNKMPIIFSPRVK